MEILHITAHLGGGVGKALSGLVTQARIANPEIKHTFVSLEAPEKAQFVDIIREEGGTVIFRPNKIELEDLIVNADIVHLEWWNHPVTIRCLCSLSNQPMRLLAWSHGSGLFNPTIPKELVLASHKFLFTSPCSFENPEMKALSAELGNRLASVSSSGGFEGLPEVSHNTEEKPLSVGYFGASNFAKLHPHYVKYLAAVNISDFHVDLIGDLTNEKALLKQCKDAGKEGLLRFKGYTTDIAKELGTINVNAYLLNPQHYGTTENALLEAMAMGIVPVVLNNACERNIVEHEKTGLIVNSVEEFATAIRWLSDNPLERVKLGNQAAKSIRERFSPEKMEASLQKHYSSILSEEKRTIDFSRMFGTDPSDWFLSCQGERELFADDGTINAPEGATLSYGLFEESKGTVFHYQAHFPENKKIEQWATNLRLRQ